MEESGGKAGILIENPWRRRRFAAR